MYWKLWTFGLVRDYIIWWLVTNYFVSSHLIFLFFYFLQNKQLSIVRLLVLTWLCQQGKSFFPWKWSHFAVLCMLRSKPIFFSMSSYMRYQMDILRILSNDIISMFWLWFPVIVYPNFICDDSIIEDGFVSSNGMVSPINNH